MIPALANHVLQSTVFAVVAAMLTLFLRNNHARARYWVWFAASMKFLVPLSLFVGIGHRLSWHAAPAIVQSQVAFMMGEITQPFAVPGFSTSAPAAVANTSPLMPMLFWGVWICGFAAVLIHWSLRWRRVSAALGAAVPMQQGRELERMRRLQGLIGMRGHVRLISAATQTEPGVFGILKPILALPEGIADHLDDDAQLEAVLTHELCHIRHRDNLTSAIHMLVEAVFWFHPLVWWLGARMVQERERACDEEVIRLGSAPEIYAEAILKICRFYLASPLVCVAGISGANLKKRIEDIMENSFLNRLSAGKKMLLGVVGLLALITPVAVGIMSAPYARAQGDPPLPKFDAASIKPTAPQANGQHRVWMHGGPGTEDPSRIAWANVSLTQIVINAYHAYLYQITGLPLGSEAYDINATIPPGATREQFNLMLQNLLLERFHLVLHHESKDVPGYELVRSKSGSKLKESPEVGSDGEAPLSGPASPSLADANGFPKRDRPGVEIAMKLMPKAKVPTVFLTARGQEVANLVHMIGEQLGRPVVDKTGLTGKYDYTLEFAAATPPPAGLDDGPDESGPDIGAAVQEQLGLKLVPMKVQLDMLVVDHVEKPTAN